MNAARAYQVQAAPQEHYQWIVDRLGIYPSKGFRAIEALDGNGQIQGMVAYDGWTQNGCFMHVAIESKMAGRRLLGPAFEYVFVQAAKGVALGLIRAGNAAAINNALSLGFKEVHRIQDGWAEGEAMILFELRKSDWMKRGHKQ